VATELQTRSQPSSLVPHPPPPAGRITTRCLLIGLAAIPMNCYWVGMVEGVWHGLHFTCLSLPMNVVFMLMLLIGLNEGLRRWQPRVVLSQAELITIFIMLATSSVLCGHDRLVTLMGAVAHARRYASPENRWETLFLNRLSDWFVVKDYEASWYYYTGGSSYWGTGYWRQWVKPAITWTCFSASLVFVMLCLNVIMRKRWTETERLSYPIIQIPLAMTEPGSNFWHNRVMWFGFGIAAALDTINGLSYLFPVIPSFTYAGPALDIQPHLTERPWSAMGSTRLDFYPFMVGLGFLLPQDLIFSTWFFYLFGKAQLVWGSVVGITESVPLYPYFGIQAAGAVLALAVAALWEARSYLRQVARRVMGYGRMDDSEEAMSYRAAAIGAGLGFILLCGFGRMAGLSATVVVPYFLIFFLVALSIARLRAESGAPAHGLANVNPQDVLITHFGATGFDHRSLNGMALFAWFNRFNRAHPMPVQLEGFKVSQTLRLEHRRMFLAIILASAFTLLCGFVIYPPLMYRHGAALAAELNWTGWYTYNTLADWLQSPRPPDHAGMAAFAGGGAFALLLALIRTRYVWFPFHPMGYALGIGNTVERWWFALVVCSFLKGVIVHYGGIRTYRQALPFFMGLVLGQYVVSCIWSIIAVVWDTPMYWSWQG
jgi:Family of unknown function (DUF6785)/Domain of unknown function (DUF6784)